MAVTLSTWRYIALAFNISTVYIALGLLLSLQPPFYPSEAERKGATPAQYGFVFGIANLSLFIFSPVFGAYGATIGPKTCFNIGAVMQGVSGFLFAFLPDIESTGWFIGLSYLLRFLEGAGTAMAWSAALGILMKIFPNKVARVMSWTQTCFGLGYMLGPAVGAGLYDAGGFMLPFLVVGSISTFLSACLVCTIPDLRDDEEEEADETDHEVDEESSLRRGNGRANGHLEGRSHRRVDSQTSAQPPPVLRFRTLFSSLSLLLPFVDLFSALCGNGMLESMLEPHLRFAGASTMEVGVSFLLFGCCYMLGNIFFGGIMDKTGSPIAYSVAGNLCFLITFLLVGPVPFVPVAPTKGLIQGMMALAGVAYAALVVSSFSRAQKRVLEMGFADDINTYVMISGIWMSAFALGNFVGPTVAGLVVQVEGFSNTTFLFFLLYAIMLTVDIIQAVYQALEFRHRNDYEELD